MSLVQASAGAFPSCLFHSWLRAQLQKPLASCSVTSLLLTGDSTAKGNNNFALVHHWMPTLCTWEVLDRYLISGKSCMGKIGQRMSILGKPTLLQITLFPNRYWHKEHNWEWAQEDREGRNTTKACTFSWIIIVGDQGLIPPMTLARLHVTNPRIDPSGEGTLGYYPTTPGLHCWRAASGRGHASP